jgi:SRSO17 transposase
VKRSGEGSDVDLEELRKLRCALDCFVGQFDDCISTAPSRRHLRRYVNGQLGPLERKSVEPIALDAGVPPRTLQEFLSQHRWDEEAVGKRLRQVIVRDHGDPNAIAVIDETSFAKKGKQTVGVHRQHCGATGKTDNCVITVHLGYVAEDFHGLLDGDLYLPKETWAEDLYRRRAAGIPDHVVFRPKWKIALDLLGRARQEGVRTPWLTADEDYGRVREFRDTIASWGMTYVVEIPSSISGWTKMPEVEPVGTVTASGRTLTRPRLAVGEREARQVSSLWPRGGPSWTPYQVKTTDKGPIVWEVRHTQFFPNDDGVPGKAERLMVLREVLTGEVKYFLSNAASEVPLKTLLYVAFSRWRIERLFEDGKGEVGLDHFEVRCYRSLMRHLVLTAMSLCFLCEQTDRLRKKKPVVVTFPGKESPRSTARSRDATKGATPPPQEGSLRDSSLAGTECPGGLLSRQAQTA